MDVIHLARHVDFISPRCQFHIIARPIKQAEGSVKAFSASRLLPVVFTAAKNAGAVVIFPSDPLNRLMRSSTPTNVSTLSAGSVGSLEIGARVVPATQMARVLESEPRCSVSLDSHGWAIEQRVVSKRLPRA